MSKFIISTGGTGGHIIPAIAIAEELMEREEDLYILLIGPKVHFKYLENFPRKVYPRKDKLSIIFYTLRLSRRILNSKGVLAFGSYASFPSLFWSYILNKPFFIVELNVIPGRITRMFYKKAKAVFTAFEETKNYLKGENIYTTGVPIRKYEHLKKVQAKEILRIHKDKKCVLVVGGSQGSLKLNRIALEVASEREDLEFIVVAGKSYRYIMRSMNIPRNAHVFEFFEDMSLVYSASDVAISRAGGGVIGELLYFKIPSVLIPYPFAKDNHQFYNAKAIHDKGAGLMLIEEDLTKESLMEKLNEVLNNRESFKRNIMHIRKENAREEIANFVHQLTQTVE